MSKGVIIVKKIIKKAKDEGYLENMELREIISNRIIFNRKKSGNCKLCDRNHENENNIYIILCNTSFKIYCRRNDDKFIEFSNSYFENNKEGEIDSILNKKQWDFILFWYNITPLEII